LWKTSVQKRHKVFFWLLLKDRLSTRNILWRRKSYRPMNVFSAISMLRKLWSIFFYIAILHEAAGHLYICSFPLGTPLLSSLHFVSNFTCLSLWMSL
jgi:hypothetical protein